MAGKRDSKKTAKTPVMRYCPNCGSKIPRSRTNSCSRRCLEAMGELPEVYLPTPEVIKSFTEIIQGEWSEDERKRRTEIPEMPAGIPECSVLLGDHFVDYPID